MFATAEELILVSCVLSCAWIAGEPTNPTRRRRWCESLFNTPGYLESPGAMADPLRPIELDCGVTTPQRIWYIQTGFMPAIVYSGTDLHGRIEDKIAWAEEQMRERDRQLELMAGEKTPDPLPVVV